VETSIVFIAPSQELADLFTEVSRECGRGIPVFVGELQEGVRRARQLLEDQIDVLISRGGTALALKRFVEDIPVVDVPITGFDVLRAVHKARQATDRIVIGGFRPFTGGIEGLEESLGISLRVLTLQEGDQAETVKARLLAYVGEGFHWVVGDTLAAKLARQVGMEAVVIQSGKGALLQAIAEAERVAMVRRVEMEKTQRMKCITDFAYEGIVSVDSSGTIETFNPSAEKILGISADKALGRPIQETFPEIDLLAHLRTGQRELGKVLSVGGRKIAANIVPVSINGDVLKVVASFQKVSGIQSIEQRIRRDLAQTGLTAASTFRDIVASSRVMRRLKKEAEEYAQFDLPVLLTGQTGTGKELFAQAIHNASPRAGKPFVAFNCAALPASLLESELFGYAEGAFTGASKGGKLGIFELAHGGTLFLDEIGEISMETQVRLLRVLEEKKVRRVGDDRLTPIDVRIIVATNEDLKGMVEERRFRQDLFYRINVLVLELPPLRERRDDLPLLCELLVRKYSLLFGKDVQEISPAGLKMMGDYGWPGNVRQLENVIERMVVRARGRTIGASVVQAALHNEVQAPLVPQSIERHLAVYSGGAARVSIPPDLGLRGMERLIIEKAIEEARGNRNLAARRLGIGRTTLWRKLRD
jgi:PAS domain S-box-containing protein